jgi:hypothetical protein
MLPWLDIFIYGLPGCGKTHFILSSYWEKDGKRGGPVVFDFDKRGVDATAADMGLSDKIPVLALHSEEEMIWSCSYPEEVKAIVAADPKFKDYEVEVFAYDTVSSMEEIILGETPRVQTPLLPATQGNGLMAIQRRRDGSFEPALGDYKALVNRTKAFLRRVREMPQHTIVTCHASKALTPESPRGLKTPEEDKQYGIYPMLTGDNKYNCAKWHDFFLYMTGKQGMHTSHTRGQGTFVARTRLESKLKPQINGLTFQQLKAEYDKARGIEG